MPYVQGAKVHGVIHVADVYHSSNVFVNNVPVALWDEPGPTSAVIGGVYISDNPFKLVFAETIINEAGTNAPHDDPDSTVVDYGVPDNSQESTTSTVVAETGTNAVVGTGENINSEGLNTAEVNYEDQLSPNFKVKDLSINATFKHNIVAQNGLSIADILLNMRGVAVNILEPLRAQYPGFRINSGFRKGEGNSQHNKGMAVDIQWPGLSPAGYSPIAEWVKNNLPLDQLIFEHGNSIWLHISYDRTKTRQRGQLLTYYPRNSPQYTPGLTNYYV